MYLINYRNEEGHVCALIGWIIKEESGSLTISNDSWHDGTDWQFNYKQSVEIKQSAIVDMTMLTVAPIRMLGLKS